MYYNMSCNYLVTCHYVNADIEYQLEYNFSIRTGFRYLR